MMSQSLETRYDLILDTTSASSAAGKGSAAARRVNDGDVLRLLKKILKANGKKGVPQGSDLTLAEQRVPE